MYLQKKYSKSAEKKVSKYLYKESVKVTARSGVELYFEEKTLELKKAKLLKV